MTARPADDVWPLDPDRLNVELSRWRHLPPIDPPPAAFCVELGRRLLLAQLEFSEWVIRRIDTVDLQRDRSVTRHSSFEFVARADAPRFRTDDRRELLLLPLTVMRRRTLVNMHFWDEADGPVTMPGMRLTQLFDESILLAAAAAADRSAQLDPRVYALVRDMVSGKLEEVDRAFARFDCAVRGDHRAADLPERPLDSPLFREVVNRLRHNFTLYVLVDSGRPLHRLIRMSFDEPTAWHYQKPSLDEQFNYRVGAPRRFSLARGWAALGYSATRFRFQVPAAEKAASYHFEINSPPGVHIVRATLLAGRPNGTDKRVSVDRVVGHSPTVGLHAVEVPNGSLCRVQVDLRAPARGWLTTVLAGSFAVMAVMLLVVSPWVENPQHWANDQITNFVLFLFTTSAAVATLIAQRESGDVGSRFIGGAKALGTIACATPVAASAVLVYNGITSTDGGGASPHLAATRWLLLAAAALSILAFAAILAAWICSVVADRHAVVEESPWDMTMHPNDESDREKGRSRLAWIRRLEQSRDDYVAAVRDFRFDRQAIAVRSAEGWWDSHDWTDHLQGNAIDALNRPWSRGRGVPRGCRSFETTCVLRHDCRSVCHGNERPWDRPATAPAPGLDRV